MSLPFFYFSSKYLPIHFNSQTSPLSHFVFPVPPQPFPQTQYRACPRSDFGPFQKHIVPFGEIESFQKAHPKQTLISRLFYSSNLCLQHYTYKRDEISFLIDYSFGCIEVCHSQFLPNFLHVDKRVFDHTQKLEYDL